MTNVHITRHDRGLDSKRIQKIVDMISKRVDEIKYDRRDVLKTQRQSLERQYIKDNDLETHFTAIDKIREEIAVYEKHIAEAKKKMEPHKAEIAAHFRGDRESVYRYDDVRDDSPVDEYLKANLPDLDGMKKELSKLVEEMEEQLWLAKDIEEARELYNLSLQKIEEITKGIQ